MQKNETAAALVYAPQAVLTQPSRPCFTLQLQPPPNPNPNLSPHVQVGQALSLSSPTPTPWPSASGAVTGSHPSVPHDFAQHPASGEQ